MAKQNVSFVERHVEKIVIAVAGVVLLSVAATYLISTPHKVGVSGGSLGPKGFYAEMARQAEVARTRMQNASARPVEDPLARLKGFINEPGTNPPEPTPDSRKLAQRLPVPPGPLRPPVPEVDGDGGIVRRRVELVEILAPTRPVLTAGRAPARLPTPEMVVLGAPVDKTRRSDLLPLTSDWHWVTISAAISRKAQRAEFEEAGYRGERLELIVAEVRAERQERLPNGRWSEPQIIEPYLPTRRVVARPEIDLVREGNQYITRGQVRQYIAAFRSALERKEVQEEILRPSFQKYLADPDSAEDYRYQWKPPRELEAPDGTVIDLTGPEFSVNFALDEDATAFDAPKRTGRSAAAWARDVLKEGEKAIEASDYLEAERLWVLIVEDKDVPLPLSQRAEKLLEDHRGDFQAARHEQERAEVQQREAKSVSELGEDVEPLWVNDTTVEPGKAYRYRVSLVALNQYAGVAKGLENPLDARKLVVWGQWSEWSDPISVRPAKYLFVTRAAGDRARVEILEWTNGRWNTASNELGVGDVVAFRKGRSGPAFSYDAVIVAIDLARPYLEAIESRSGDGFKHKPGVTDTLILVNSKGEVEERLVAEDIVRKRAVKAEIQKEEKEREERLKERRPTGPGERRPAGRS